MRHYFPLLIVVILLSCFGKDNSKHSSQEKQRRNSVDNSVVLDHAQDTLQSLMTKYGKSKVLLGLCFIDRDFFNLIFLQTDTSKMLYCSMEQIVEKKISTDESHLIESVTSHLAKISSATRSQNLKKLEQWLKNDILLSSILDNNLDDQVFFEELIYQIPETKNILTVYLKSPEQYWGSLDANQSCKLYYDVNLYLTNLKPVERINFFKKYFDTACNLSIKNLHSP